MSRHKSLIPSERIRLDGYQRFPILDERDQVAWDWYVKNREQRQAFPIAWELIKAALNGELGPQVQKAVQVGNTEETIEALQDLIGAFAGENN